MGAAIPHALTRSLFFPCTKICPAVPLLARCLRHGPDQHAIHVSLNIAHQLCESECWQSTEQFYVATLSRMDGQALMVCWCDEKHMFEEAYIEVPCCPSRAAAPAFCLDLNGTLLGTRQSLGITLALHS